MSERRQIFGWTEMVQPAPGNYVRFVSAHAEAVEDFTLAIRQPNGNVADVILPGDAAVELALRILEEDRCRTARAHGLPQPPRITG